ERHRDFTGPRLAGWWGHDEHSRFHMGPDFKAMRGAEGWQVSEPPILTLAPLWASLDLFAEAGGMPVLRKLSLELTGHLAHLIQDRLADRINIITPLEPHRRGCQLSLQVRAGREAGRRLFERLEAHGVICDWREPDIIRAAPVPLYNTLEDVERLVDLIDQLSPARAR
ncbi:MAG: hypothetical protein ACLFQC_00885, partial [Wenzhouxiangella sp.]